MGWADRDCAVDCCRGRVMFRWCFKEGMLRKWGADKEGIIK